jgi:8-oxo-dGTP pyrophosphatase MutT (NUDIX family)
MGIRSGAKAIIYHRGKILLNKYQNEEGRIYYELPGGGQLQYETMEEAVIRECMEETGYRVKPLRLAAIAEEIFDDEELRKTYPDYTHRILHIFTAELLDEIIYERSEPDLYQVDNVWVDVNEISEYRLIPRRVKKRLKDILMSAAPLYLGAVHEYRPGSME